MSQPPAAPDRLTELFRAFAPRIHAYARRHVEADLCDDVVSETFLVAWRRLDRIPAEPFPWLLVVARNVVANQRRTAARADHLWFAAVGELWTQPADTLDPGQDVADGSAVLAALNECTRLEREALLLIAWEGLTPAQAARVAGCSVRAFTVRLHRGRRRLRLAFEADHRPLPAAPRHYLIEETS